MDANAVVASPRWYRTLNGEQWRVLLASNLGWLFDGFEIFALFITVGFALHQLLDPSQYAAIPRYAGYILATTVFGWATPAARAAACCNAAPGSAASSLPGCGC